MPLPFYNTNSFAYSYEKTLKMFKKTDNEHDILTNDNLRDILLKYWTGFSFSYIKLLLTNNLKAKYMKDGLSHIMFVEPVPRN